MGCACVSGFQTFALPIYLFNAPLPPGTGSRGFRAVWEDRLLPAIDAFRPQLLLVSAGFDAHWRDPLAQLPLDADDYAWLTGQLRRLAGRPAQGRLVSPLEGRSEPRSVGTRCVLTCRFLCLLLY